MPRPHLVLVSLTLCIVVSGCTLIGPAYRPAPSNPTAPLAQPQVVLGDLEVRVVYPPAVPDSSSFGSSVNLRTVEGYAIQSEDSAFVFGSVGTGDAMLEVNGVSVPVYPTGGWIAWLPLPRDSVARFDIVATTDTDTATVSLLAPIAESGRVRNGTVWLDTLSLSPVGDRWIRPDEGIRLSMRAAPGSKVRAYGPNGLVIPLLPDTLTETRSWGDLAFSTSDDSASGVKTIMDRYEGWWTGRLGPDPDIVLAPDFPTEPTDSNWIWVEATNEIDTIRVRWPLRVGIVDSRFPLLTRVNDDPNGTATTDEILAGRPTPWGTYHWFFPNGTLARVSGRWNDQVRLQLSRNSSAWVDASSVEPVRPGTPPPGGSVRSLRLRPTDRSVVLRIPLPNRIPFQISEEDRRLDVRLYGVAADIDWIQYGGTDPLVEEISFAQPSEDEVVVSVELSAGLWGYRSDWSGNDLTVEIRRPPGIDPARPLDGRVIAVDAGHPPGGATGPLGTPEWKVTLEIAQKVGALLERYGARPVLVRETNDALGLYERIDIAEAADAEVLVSIHANALPDGVNPFENNGTSVYYFHPRSTGLARELNRALVRHLGFPDLGMGRGNLALARPTWMPSALTEGLFMMLPDQEAVLVSDEGQWRYARGIVEGLAAYFRQWAMGSL